MRMKGNRGIHIEQHPSTQYGFSMQEGNVLFNDTLNTFYLRLYGIRHMVKDHSEGERGRKEMVF